MVDVWNRDSDSGGFFAVRSKLERDRERKEREVVAKEGFHGGKFDDGGRCSLAARSQWLQLEAVFSIGSEFCSFNLSPKSFLICYFAPT